MTDAGTDRDRTPPVIDMSVAHNARVWNYWLGGKDNFEADREAGDRVLAMFPDIVQVARADRAFLGRAVRFLSAEEGIRQFLDICAQWRPDPAEVGVAVPQVAVYAGVARKP